MDNKPQPHHSYLFTVRVWREELGNGQTEWRGKVQYIPNGETIYFRDWLALLAFLKKIMRGAEDSFDQGPDSHGYSQ